MSSQIKIIADTPGDPVTHTEWVNLADFDSEHFRAQLAERLAWAVGDADTAEQADVQSDRLTVGRARPGRTMAYDVRAARLLVRHELQATDHAP